MGLQLGALWAFIGQQVWPVIGAIFEDSTLGRAVANQFDAHAALHAIVVRQMVCDHPTTCLPLKMLRIQGFVSHSASAQTISSELVKANCAKNKNDSLIFMMVAVERCTRIAAYLCPVHIQHGACQASNDHCKGIAANWAESTMDCARECCR